MGKGPSFCILIQKYQLEEAREFTNVSTGKGSSFCILVRKY